MGEGEGTGEEERDVDEKGGRDGGACSVGSGG